MYCFMLKCSQIDIINIKLDKKGNLLKEPGFLLRQNKNTSTWCRKNHRFSMILFYNRKLCTHITDYNDVNFWHYCYGRIRLTEGLLSLWGDHLYKITCVRGPLFVFLVWETWSKVHRWTVRGGKFKRGTVERFWLPQPAHTLTPRIDFYGSRNHQTEIFSVTIPNFLYLSDS